ncbi:MAG TPA: tetratricopeptide repeat protein [Parafilimonas sp.]|nr:tetratricopeptide repeat protein [Parafilimonas sp.]
MRKLVFVILFFGSITALAQSNYVDSLKAKLSTATRSLDSFSIIVKISEFNFVLGGGEADKTTIIRLLSIAQKLKNDSLLAISYNWIGSYFAFTKGDNTAALEYYFKALPLAQKAKDRRRVSSLYFDIALVYFTLQNREEAVKNLRRGKENLPDPSSPMHLFMLMQYQRGMSQYYILCHQNDSALNYTQQLSATSLKLKSLSFQYGALYLGSSVYTQMGDKDMADVYFKKAVAMTPLITSSASRLNFYEIYIPFLFDNGNIHEAHNQASQLMELGLRDNNNNIKLSAAGFLRQAFDSLHNIDSAYYYAKMKDALNDSIFSQNNINKIQAMEFNEQLRLMEGNARKAEEAVHRKQNIQYALISLGIIIFITLFLLLSRTIIVNERLISFFVILGLLVVFEFINLLIHPWLASFTNESPVLMLLALVVIAALLIPLHHRLEQWIKEKVIRKNKAIRLAAAKRTIEMLEKNAANV